jgi:hypothetical protein
MMTMPLIFLLLLLLLLMLMLLLLLTTLRLYTLQVAVACVGVDQLRLLLHRTHFKKAVRHPCVRGQRARQLGC